MRTRWAAIGAAVAVSVGGGGMVWMASAATDTTIDTDNNATDYLSINKEDVSVYVPIEPCRLLDTRTGADPSTSVDYSRGVWVDKPIGVSGDGATGQTTFNDITVFVDPDANASMGDCNGDFGSTQPTAVVLNVTAVNLNAPGTNATSYVTLYPWEAMSGTASVDLGSRPYTSHLNPREGDGPTPNAVTVGLASTSGLTPNYMAFRIFNKAGLVDIFIDVVGYYYSQQIVADITASAGTAD